MTAKGFVATICVLIFLGWTITTIGLKTLVIGAVLLIVGASLAGVLTAAIAMPMPRPQPPKNAPPDKPKTAVESGSMWDAEIDSVETKRLPGGQTFPSKNQSIIVLRALLGLSAILSMLICAHFGDAEPPPPTLNDSSRAVEQTLRVKFKEYNFEEVSIRGGMGVLLNGLGAYWVKDGRVYALNGLAASYSPGITYGPQGLGKSELLEALASKTSPSLNEEQSERSSRSPELMKVEDDVRRLLRLGGVSLIEDKSSPDSFVGTGWQTGGGIFSLRLTYKGGRILSYHAEAYPNASIRSNSFAGQEFSDRDRKIDAFVDEQVEKHWRPMPGGNNKQGAARLTKEILKARTWEELDRALKRNGRE
jgi:hypothetical protein